MTDGSLICMLVCRIPDMAAMHQDMSEDLMVVGEKLDQILGVWYHNNGVNLVSLEHASYLKCPKFGQS